MTEYVPPLKEMRFTLTELSGLDEVLGLPAFTDVDSDTVGQVIDEAGKFARDVLAPLNIPGDREGCRVEDRAVQVADGFADAYRHFIDNGWQALAGSPEFGGMGFPEGVAVATFEMWQSANMAFSLCPMLTSGAITAIEAHGTPAMQQSYLPKLISGEWSGTMVLTEPQAGSDLAAITTRAVPEGDHYRITGTKIYITWGDHPMAENTIHLVLARLPDAPEGVRGISMFLVPKFLLDENGAPGKRNDAYPVSVEHKLGIHASPTCVMNFGDDEGAVGYLIGEENKGLANMFTMMNHARIEVGVQGLALSERAYQLARSYALDRVQGVAPGHRGRVTIVKHPDVRRMLLLMKSQIEAMRGAAYAAAALLDLKKHATDEARQAAAQARLGLLTPVIKGWQTEAAQEITSLGVQIHGGMGYVEETGAAQHMRDARILPIYEGTTGIQANDFVGRKILADEGQAMKSLLADMHETVQALDAAQYLQDLAEPLRQAVAGLEASVEWLIAGAGDDPNVPGSAAVNLLMLAGTVIGGWYMAKSALAVSDENKAFDGDFRKTKMATSRFYVQHVLPRWHAYAAAACAGSTSVMQMDERAF